MLRGVTVTSASADARSRRSEPRLGHRLEHPDRARESEQPVHRRFAVWFPFAVYGISRVWVLIAGIVLARHQIALPIGTPNIRIFYPSPESPGYLSVMSGWDGQWYRVIAERGYPAVLPRAGWGGIDMNPWAFFPLFPMAVGAVMKVTGLPFDVVGPILSTLIGFVAMHLLFKLVDQAVGRWEAIVAVTATSFYIAAAAFSASYTESAALLIVVTVLLLLRARRYGWVVVALLALSLTRNVVIAMVPVIIAHAVVRWRQHDEGERPVRLRWGLAALAAYAGALTFLWPTFVSFATDTPDAYNQTMLAWNIETKVKLYLWWGLLYDYWGVVGQLLGVLAIAGLRVVHALAPLVALGSGDLGVGRCLPRLHPPRDEHDPEPGPLRDARLPLHPRHRLVPQAAVVAPLPLRAAARDRRHRRLADVVLAGALPRHREPHRRPLPLSSNRDRRAPRRRRRTSRRRSRRAARAAAAARDRRRCGGRPRWR